MAKMKEVPTFRGALDIFRGDIAQFGPATPDNVGISTMIFIPIFIGIFALITWLYLRTHEKLLIFLLVVVGGLIIMMFYFVARSIWFFFYAAGRFVVHICVAAAYFARYALLRRGWAWGWSLRGHLRRAECRLGCKTGVVNLCVACRGMVESSALLQGKSLWPVISAKERYSHHTWSELQASARICCLCDLLVGSAKSSAIPSAPFIARGHEAGDDQRLFCGNVEQRLWLQVNEERSLHERPKLTLGFEGCRSQPLLISQERVEHLCDDGLNTESPAVMRMARQWIETCHEHHPNCNIDHGSIEQDFYPTRLIWVGSGNDSNLRVVETKNLGLCNTTKYTALTHCWGSNQMPVKLKLDTIQRMRLSIDRPGLPRNFQHAISITRSMGIPYVWIDSLCIIQDSLSDWEKEASTMGQVYAHAACVISATASADFNGGCFHNRDGPRPAMPTSILAQNPKRGTALVARTPDSENRSLDELFDAYITTAPISKRGWTFQERALARRIIHFCAGVVLFECNTLRASEFDPAGTVYPAKQYLRTDGTVRTPADLVALQTVDDRLIAGTAVVQDPSSYTFSREQAARSYNQPGRTRTIRTMVANPDYMTPAEKRREFFRTAALMGLRGEFQLLLTAGQPCTMQEKAEFHSAWFVIVENYSERNIMKNTDRLIALMGIADFIQQARSKRIGGLRFVAGAWEETLALDLLWHVVRDTREPPNRSVRLEQLVPTWSWASTVGGVKVSSKLRDLQRRHGINPSTEETYPEISMLVSEVEICSGRVKKLSDGCITSAALSLNQDFQIRFSSITHDERFEDELSEEKEEAGSISSVKLADPLHHLPIIRVEYGNGDIQIHGILLRRSVDVAGEYERAGYFVCRRHRCNIDIDLLPIQNGERLVLI